MRRAPSIETRSGSTEPGLTILGAPTDSRTAPRTQKLVITSGRGGGTGESLGAPERGARGDDPRLGTRGLESLTGRNAARREGGFAPPPEPMPLIEPPPTPMPGYPDGGVEHHGAVTYHYGSFTCDWNERCADWYDGWHHGWHRDWCGDAWGWCGWPSSWFSWCGSDWSISIGFGWGWSGWCWPTIGWCDPWWCGWDWNCGWRPARWCRQPARAWCRPTYVRRFGWYDVSPVYASTSVSLHDAWTLDPLACADPAEAWCMPASSSYLAGVEYAPDVVDGPLDSMRTDGLEQAFVTLRDGDVVAADLAFARIVRDAPTELDARFGLFVTRWLWLDPEGATTALRPILRMDPTWLLGVPREEFLDLQYRRVRDVLHRRADDGDPEALLGAAAIDVALGDMLSAYFHADRAAGTRYAEEAASLKTLAANAMRDAE